MVALVQHVQGGSSATFAAGTTANNLVVVTTTSIAGTVTAVKLGATSLAQDVSILNTTNPTASINDYVYSLPGCPAAQTAIAITSTGTAGCDCYEVSGIVTSSALDKSATQQNGAVSGTSFSSTATATTTVAAEFWVGVCGSIAGSGGTNVTITGPASPWNNEAEITLGSLSGHLSGYQVASATGAATYSGTLSPSSYYAAAAATYKGTGAAAPSGQLQPRGTVPIPRRPPRRAVLAWITGRPPPATPNRQPPPGPRPRPPRRAITAWITGRPPPATPNRQPPPGPRPRPPRRALTAFLTGRPPPAAPLGTPNRQPPPGPRPRPPGRAWLRSLAGAAAPAPPVPAGRPVPVPDDKPWLKRARVKWYRHGPPLSSWYGSEIPAGLASAYTASGRVDDPGYAAVPDAPAAEPERPAVPADSDQPDRRLRGRVIDRIRRGRRYRPGRPVWPRDTVVPAAGDSFDHQRSERLIDSYRLPRPGWRSTSEYSFPVVQRRKRRPGDSGSGDAAG